MTCVKSCLNPGLYDPCEEEISQQVTLNCDLFLDGESSNTELKLCDCDLICKDRSWNAVAGCRTFR